MKYLLFGMLGLLACLPTVAQTSVKASGGLCFTDFSVNPSTGEYRAQPGLMLGAGVSVGRKWYIEPGLYYVNKSVGYFDTGNVPAIDDVDTRMKGFRVPLAVGVNFVTKPDALLHFRAFGGPSAFFVTKVSDPVNKDNLNKTAFGLFAGGGIDFWRLFFDASYEWSLTEVSKDLSAINVGKTKSLFLQVGLRIPVQ